MKIVNIQSKERRKYLITFNLLMIGRIKNGQIQRLDEEVDENKIKPIRSIGDTSKIAGIADGTLTGAIREISDKNDRKIYLDNEKIESTSLKLEEFDYSWVDTLPYDFRGGRVVNFRGEIHLIGGRGNPSAHYKFKGDEWIRLENLPFEFTYGGAVVFNDEIHIVGSIDGGGTQHCKWNGNEWTTVGLFDTYWSGGTISVCNDTIHMIQNLDSGFLAYHRIFKDGGWRAIAILQSKNWSLGVYKNELYGIYKDDYSLYKFNSNSNEWIPFTTIPLSLPLDCLIVYQDKIFIFNEYFNKFVYWQDDIFSREFTAFPNKSVGAICLSDGYLLSLDDGIHLFGGDSQNDDRNHHLIRPKYSLEIN